MTIQCDVCSELEASVYCSSDEAALCDSCDYAVHHANKLASKHYRFNLLTPSAKDAPFCDICQEKRAFLFCQQDRAILCNHCDASIHAVNEHTRKHDRFLLTGVKPSAKSVLYASPASSLTGGCCDLVRDFKSQPSGANTAKNTDAAGNQFVQKTSSVVSAAAKSGICGSSQLIGDSGLTSSISEYLTETLPGWLVEDLLNSSAAPYGFSKELDVGQLFPSTDAYVLGHNDLMGSLLPEDNITWASQVPSISLPFPQIPHYHTYTQAAPKLTTNTKVNNSRKLFVDDGFTVPQISRPQPSKDQGSYDHSTGFDAYSFVSYSLV